MKSQEKHKYFVFFLAGFLLGVLYIYFTGEHNAESTDFFSVQNLMQLQYVEMDYKDYFVYLLKKRFGVLLMLAALSFALAGRYLLLGFLMLFGCSMGSMLSLLVVRYGVGGMLLFGGLIFPQDIVYLPVVFDWVTVLAEWNVRLFGHSNVAYRMGRTKYSGVSHMIVLCGVTIIGILLECYVNPVIVKFCLKIF